MKLYIHTHNQAYLTCPNVTDLTAVRVALIKPELRVWTVIHLEQSNCYDQPAMAMFGCPIMWRALAC